VNHGIIVTNKLNEGGVSPMKKLLLTLGLAMLMTAPAWAANLWQYNSYTTIDMSTAKVKHDKGMKILTFDTTEKIDTTTSYCTYVYNVDDQTIQLQEMTTVSKKLKYTSNFYPESIKTGNKAIQERAAMAQAVLAKVEAKNARR